MKQIFLKEPVECRLLNTPFPADTAIDISRVGETMVMHHPADPKVTKTVRAENVRKIVIRDKSESAAWAVALVKDLVRDEEEHASNSIGNPNPETQDDAVVGFFERNAMQAMSQYYQFLLMPFSRIEQIK